ncbi:MAG: hypothetical protein FJX35_06105 [Alphaproteobacteria bacterium]|nr:hypothetical protein [Alphaproteobacteria bacterium]
MDRRNKTRRPYGLSALSSNVDYWLARAEEARTMADSMMHVETKETLLSIAEGYDRLAGNAEKRRPASARRGRARQSSN